MNNYAKSNKKQLADVEVKKRAKWGWRRWQIKFARADINNAKMCKISGKVTHNWGNADRAVVINHDPSSAAWEWYHECTTTQDNAALYRAGLKLSHGSDASRRRLERIPSLHRRAQQQHISVESSRYLNAALNSSGVVFSVEQCGCLCLDVDDNQTSIQEDRAPPIVPHPPQGIDPLKPYTDIFLLATKLWDVCLHFSSTEIGQKLWLQLRKMSNLLIYMSWQDNPVNWEKLGLCFIILFFYYVCLCHD